MKLCVTLIATGSFLAVIFPMFPFDAPEKPLVFCFHADQKITFGR